MTRGTRRYTRRFIEELEDIYLDMKNKDGSHRGIWQLSPREVRMWEVVFPANKKKEIKKIIKDIAKRNEWCAVKFGPFKKDKFVEGKEFL